MTCVITGDLFKRVSQNRSSQSWVTRPSGRELNRELVLLGCRERESFGVMRVSLPQKVVTSSIINFIYFYGSKQHYLNRERLVKDAPVDGPTTRLFLVSPFSVIQGLTEVSGRKVVRPKRT